MLILASQSPRRRELLKIITDKFSVIPSDADESFPPGSPPSMAAELIAMAKADKIAASFPSDTVIGADTLVVIDGQILGKPKDTKDAMRMLQLLSGKTHEVVTGVAVLVACKRTVFYESTLVTFRKLSASDIDEYTATGDPLDKAGAYGIQGPGALLVKGINGDFYNVMGLPIARLSVELRQLGVKF
ncbi:MAG: Maf family protein [Oscillospiraceae bacterium]|nr:Maf family protein [Oscillospiraceae bacterium]